MTIDQYVTQPVQTGLNALGDLVIDYPGVVFTLLVIALTLSIVSLLYNLRRNAVDASHTTQELEEMRKRQQLDQMYADDFGDVLFSRLCDGTIDRHEYKRACRRFGLAYKLSDLLVKKNDKRGRKFRILRAIQISQETPSAVGKIPGPKPGEQVPTAQPKTRKVYIVRGKVLLHRKSAN